MYGTRHLYEIIIKVPDSNNVSFLFTHNRKDYTQEMLAKFLPKFDKNIKFADLERIIRKTMLDRGFTVTKSAESNPIIICPTDD